MNILRSALFLFVFLCITTGIVYPLFVTCISNNIFEKQSLGSLIRKNNKIIGSVLIGQFISDEKYFYGRPSLTYNKPYNAISSHGSNLSVNNPDLLKQFILRSQYNKNINEQNNTKIPIDLITASASGLDPHITLSAAYYQANRISKIRHIPLYQLKKMIFNNIEKPIFTFLTEPIINVLILNIKLDELELIINKK